MGINQNNLPLELFDTDEDGTPNIDEFDCDPPATDNLEAGDGLITFRDLECAEQLWIDDRPPRPLDILESSDWLEGQTDPDVEHLGNFENELVGWSFRSGDNRPVEDTGRFPSMHGTSVSGVLAAQGDHRDNEGEPVGIPKAA